MIKADEFKKSSVIKSESYNNDRIFETAQTIEMDRAEDHNLIASNNNDTNESIPESRSTIQSLESLPESEKILSGGDIELVETELKSSSESVKIEPLSTDILDVEQSVDQNTLDIIIPKLDLSSETTNSANLELNYNNSADQVSNGKHL